MTTDDWPLWQSQAKHELDTCGLFCPEPVMLLHNVVRDAKAGEAIFILATDPSTQRDIPKFCQFLGHRLKGQCESAGKYYYLLEKAG